MRPIPFAPLVLSISKKLCYPFYIFPLFSMIISFIRSLYTITHEVKDRRKRCTLFSTYYTIKPLWKTANLTLFFRLSASQSHIYRRILSLEDATCLQGDLFTFLHFDVY